MGKIQSSVCQRETRTTSGLRMRRKIPLSSWNDFGFALFFRWWSSCLATFPSKFRNSYLFCTHLVSYNSCSSVFSAQHSERVSTGNHNVIIFIISPGLLIPAETQHCAGAPQTARCIGQGCTSVRLMLHMLHEHARLSPKAIPAFKTYETWLIEMPVFLHSGNFGDLLPANKK